MKTIRIRKMLSLLSVSGFLLLSAAGCASLYHTKYTNEKISIGDTKESVTRKFGRPYSESMYSENGKTMEKIQYKEILAYGNVDTWFYFENGKLIRKTQKEEKPSDCHHEHHHKDDNNRQQN